MLRTLFILSILVPGFFLSLRNRYVALLMYLWFALFRPQDWLWIDITSLRMSLVLGIILVVPAIASGLFPNVTNPLSVGMIGFSSAPWSRSRWRCVPTSAGPGSTSWRGCSSRRR